MFANPCFFPISLAHWPMTLSPQNHLYTFENPPFGSCTVSRVWYRSYLRLRVEERFSPMSFLSMSASVDTRTLHLL